MRRVKRKKGTGIKSLKEEKIVVVVVTCCREATERPSKSEKARQWPTLIIERAILNMKTVLAPKTKCSMSWPANLVLLLLMLLQMLLLLLLP